MIDRLGDHSMTLFIQMAGAHRRVGKSMGKNMIFPIILHKGVRHIQEGNVILLAHLRIEEPILCVSGKGDLIILGQLQMGMINNDQLSLSSVNCKWG